MQPMQISAANVAPSTQTGSMKSNSANGLLLPRWRLYAGTLIIALMLGVLIFRHSVEDNPYSFPPLEDQEIGQVYEEGTSRSNSDSRSILQTQLKLACRIQHRSIQSNMNEDDVVVMAPRGLLLPSPKKIWFTEASTADVKLVAPLFLHNFVRISVTTMNERLQLEKREAELLRQGVQVFCANAISTSPSSPLSGSSFSTSSSSIEINIVDVDRHSSCILNGDEAYNITLSSHDRIEVSACSPIAAQFAISSTLLQLFASKYTRLDIPSFPYIIEDYPQYPWRGLMIDVARHFIPIPLLKRSIDAMQVAKLNVLHLHLTDSQSFPILLDDTPELQLSKLAHLGAYDATKMYDKKSLIDIVKYASIRGIKIIPEIDVPAHVYAWGKAFPEVIVNCTEIANANQSPLDIYTFDPSNPLTYELISQVLEQIADIFPSQHFHIGGDEINFRCWESKPALKKWIYEEQNATSHTILQQFESRVYDIVHSLKKSPITWQGVIDSGALPDRVMAENGLSDHDAEDDGSRPIVQSWKCWSGLSIRASKNALKKNYSTIMSACWYLDYDVDWLAMMSADQLGTTLDKHKEDADIMKNSKYALGGEAAIWTENVDHTNFECRLWPRAIAIATRLWGLDAELVKRTELVNGQTVTINPDKSIDILSSIVHLRHVLVGLGIRAAPVVFHRPVVDSPSSLDNHDSFDDSIAPEGAFWSEVDGLKSISSYQRVGMTMTSNNKLLPKQVEGSYRLTCRCEGFRTSSSLQRPIHMDTIKVSQLNVADGHIGVGKSSVLDWFLEKANAGTLLIGLCELNGWEKLQSRTDLNKNMPYSSYYAAKGGFPHSFVMVNTQPYHLGVLSALPLQVFGQHGPPTFQRGLLHVFIEVLELHVFVAHLHAHDAKMRTKESEEIVRIMQPLLANNSRVLLMGDMNTLSPLDRLHHEEIKLVETLQRHQPSVWPRLGKKFLKEDDHGSIDYKPMELLLQAGFIDSCTESCRIRSKIKKDGSGGVKLWSFHGNDAFSVCVKSTCPATEPTQYSMEWPDLPNGEKHPAVRLDYVLLSPAIVQDSLLGSEALRGFVESNNRTKLMSDHLPMSVEWGISGGYDLY